MIADLLRLLRSRRVQLITFLLAVQCVAAYALKRSEVSPPLPAFEKIPTGMGKWSLEEAAPVEVQVLAALQPDVYINRAYQNNDRRNSSALFAAYFRSSDHSGPHSPKVCLPASGWRAESERVVDLRLAQDVSIPVNEYILEKGRRRILVHYWYQNARRVWAEEFVAKVHVLPDLIRFRRSDVSLIRVVTPVVDGSMDSTRETSIDFVREVYPRIAELLGAS